MNVRPPAVAGTFYPNNPERLRETVTGFLEASISTLQHHSVERGSGQAVSPQTRVPPPKAIIAPHAGYIYSGPIAASAYVPVIPLAGKIKRVLIFSPAHTIAVHGLATTSAQTFQTPLGDVGIDQNAIKLALTLPQVQVLDAAHVREHGIEVHLPFLQEIASDFSLVPFVVGHSSPEEVNEVIEALWGGVETLIVISSDLSHFLTYEQAQQLDGATCAAIERLQPEAIQRDGACGRRPIQGLLLSAKRRNMSVVTLDLRNSGDTAGSKARVVGYGAWAFSEQVVSDY
ncbi:MAG: AmmeMemoRadiSam system protein B [Anaerolineae bacterium]|nr:AmmeMemoRadiSam system protein B [Anaerolineae bacterium]